MEHTLKTIVLGFVGNFGMYILLIVHSVFRSVNYLACYCDFIFNFFKNQKIRTCINHDIKLITQEVQCYPKLPKHLVVIIEEEISYIDCMKLILWCTCSGISFISFYSYENAINPTSFYEDICKENRSLLQSIKWGNSFHKCVKEMAKRDINGYKWQPVVEVNVFSSQSVRNSLDGVMRRLCDQRPSHLTVDAVHHTYSQELPLPDPCFALIFGPTFSTYGFFPWQIRVTEFLNVPTHHNLQVEDFVSALRCYAFCDQRFGK